MIPELAKLEDDELKTINMLPVWVTLLIADADNKIEDREILRAVKLITKKEEESAHSVALYYKLIAQNLETDLKGYRAVLPDDKESRDEIIIEKLKSVNTIWPKIEKTFAVSLYESLKELARKVAEASGGILGYNSISPEEEELLDLKMINNPKK